MSGNTVSLSRRAVLAGLGASALPCRHVMAAGHGAPLMRPIPSTGVRVPAIGMGTWITFNVGEDQGLREHRSEVLRAFFEAGGTVIDSSPMYGSSEAVVGYGLRRIGRVDTAFSATKVWTPMQFLGAGQMEESRELWGVDSFDLMQVHNLLNWDGHLETIRADREKGLVRHIGITTSHGRRHEEMVQVMRSQPLDAVQLTYNAVDRQAERRLLPLAAERGLAVVVNRPFRRGSLPDRLAGKPVPGWAAEIDCTTWPQVLLKFIVSHPAVTCAIPATSRIDHMKENMVALYGRLPDDALRRRMAADIDAAL